MADTSRRARAGVVALAGLAGFKDFSGDAFHIEQDPELRSRAFYVLEAFSVGRLRQFVAV